jgi:hypothetical protein
MQLLSVMKLTHSSIFSKVYVHYKKIDRIIVMDYNNDSKENDNNLRRNIFAKAVQKREEGDILYSLPSCKCLFFKGCQLQVALLPLHDYEGLSLFR